MTPTSAARAIVLTTLVATGAGAQTTALVRGMELVYESNGVASAPWRVELVEHNVSRGDRTGCVRVQFAPGGPRATTDVRVTCERDGVLFAWDSVRSSWRASRPIRPGGTLEVRGGTSVSTYTVGRAIADTIGGRAFRVLETTVVTRDSAGRATRRLRERYAPELGTATWGAFESPDWTAASGWRVATEFRLVAVREPRR